MSSEHQPIRKVVRASVRPADRDREPDPRPARKPTDFPPRTYLFAGLTLFTSMTAALVVAAVVLLIGARMAVSWQLAEWREQAEQERAQAAQEIREKQDEFKKRWEKK